MVRDTSIEAFHEIKESGSLSKRRFEVFAALFEHGPATGSELLSKMQTSKNTTHSNIRARLGELREAGVVRELQERTCAVTGKRVIEWDVTSSLPAKFDKPIEHKCPTCKGTGKITQTQGRLF